jgi:polyadenylate-binding protein
MNFKPIRNRPCRIMWSHRDPSLRKTGLGNIFVKNLAPSIDNKTLFDTFSMFGNILSCKVAVDAERKSLGYGFVHYESEEAASNAIAKADAKMIAGQKIEVKAFKSKKERQGGSAALRFTNVYAKNLPESSTVESVREMFAAFGEITSVNAPMKEADDEGKTPSKGFAFINFASPDEASAAVDALNEKEIDGKVLFVGRAQKKEEREKELREKFEQRKVEQQKKYAGVNLYIKNLGDQADDDVLREQFAKFGSITSCRIMKDPNGKAKGFGFVCFATPEEATKAVTAMNGHMFEGKPLYVALAQRKEFRRAQLEAQHAQRQKGMGMPQPQMYPPQGAPMFYQNMAQRAMMGYPRQMVAQRYPNGPMMGVRGQPMNYQLMPVGGVRGQPGPNRNNNRRGRGSGSQPNRKNVAGAQQGYAYNEKVRNNRTPAAPAATPAPQPTPAAAPQNDFASQLASASETQRRQMIGEKLYPLVHAKQPQEAGKITGMLLEMEDSELISLLDSEDALDSKIVEAIQVLQKHAAAAAPAAAAATATAQ